MSSLGRKGCFKCGNIGHVAANCESTTRLCFNCRSPEHESSQCPSPSVHPSLHSLSPSTHRPPPSSTQSNYRGQAGSSVSSSSFFLSTFIPSTDLHRLHTVLRSFIPLSSSLPPSILSISFVANSTAVGWVTLFLLARPRLVPEDPLEVSEVVSRVVSDLG